jgi:hypothetical protein
MANLTNTKRSPSNYLERFRLLFQKHSFKEVVRHLPVLAEILVRTAGGDVPGVVGGLLRAIVGLSDGRERAAGPREDRFLSLLTEGEQLTARCEMLEQANEKLRSEVAGLTVQTKLLSDELRNLKIEMESLKKRNAYLAWGLLIVFLVACSALAWKFFH